MTTTQPSAVDEDAPRPLRKDAARNRDALIAAGRVVFAERGLDASLDDVAREAGVGVGTAYRNFANKFELAQAIFVRSIEEIVTLVEKAETVEPAWDGVVAMLEGAARAQIADRGLREILMGVHDAEAFDQITVRLAPPSERLVARAQAEGSLRADVAASDLWIALIMLFTVSDLTHDVAPDLWRRYLSMLLDGLRPGSAVPAVGALDSDAMRDAMRTHKQRAVHGLDDRPGPRSC